VLSLQRQGVTLLPLSVTLRAIRDSLRELAHSAAWNLGSSSNRAGCVRAGDRLITSPRAHPHGYRSAGKPATITAASLVPLASLGPWLAGAAIKVRTPGRPWTRNAFDSSSKSPVSRSACDGRRKAKSHRRGKPFPGLNRAQFAFPMTST
jgi:hypothetical protein